MEKLLALPVGLLAALGLFVLVQVSLQVYGLFDLARRDRVASLPKWAWALIILFGELLGVILYLLVGRNVPTEAVDPMRGQQGTPPAEDRAEHAADVLYGERSDR
jgi:hypothetical protein